MTIHSAALQFLASSLPGQDISAVLAGIPDAIPRHTASTARPISRISKFPPRRYQRSPDRAKSRVRRRGIACDYGRMPPQVRRLATESEAAVWGVIADAVQIRGYCDDPLDLIAAHAGVTQTTVQNAIWLALGGVAVGDHPRKPHRDFCGIELKRLITVELRPVPGRKHKTSIIRIVSPEWLAWLERRPTGFKTVSAAKFLHSTKVFIDDAAHRTETKKLATEICAMVGIDPLACPAGWTILGAKVDEWLNDGWTRGLILFGVRNAMLSDARKREGPPMSPAYFDKPIRQAMTQFGGNAKAADETWVRMFPGAIPTPVERQHGIRLECG